MSGEGTGARWIRAVLWGGLAGFLPVPLILGGVTIWAEATGAGQIQAEMMLLRMGLVVGLGGGALLALGAGWWVARKAGRARVGHGLVAGVSAALVGAAVVFAAGASLTVPIVAAWLLRPPAGALGGWLAERRTPALSSEAAPG